MKPVSKRLFQDTAKLKQKKYRDLQGRYLISGLNAIQGALASGQEPLAVFIMQGREHLAEAFSAWLSAGIYSVTEKEFGRIVDEKNPQGIALLMKRPFPDFNTFRPLHGIFIYLEAVNDPGNLGTIIRSALWFGADTILLSPGSADPFQPKVVRASAGAAARIHLYEQVEPTDLERLKKETHLQIAATVVHGGVALNSFTYASETPLLLAFGSEAHGLSDEMVALSDIRLTIPKKGKLESLNLAISAALCLYEITREK